jgi:hypothetical protein
MHNKIIIYYYRNKINCVNHSSSGNLQWIQYLSYSCSGDSTSLIPAS